MITATDVSELLSSVYGSFKRTKHFLDQSQLELKTKGQEMNSVAIILISQMNTKSILKNKFFKDFENNIDFKKVMAKIYNNHHGKYFKIKGDNQDFYTNWIQYFNVSFYITF